MKIVRFALSTLGVLALSVSLAQAAPLKIGDTMQPFTLKNLDGADVTVSLDKKVNVVSFWVSTCSLCKEELKTINELSEKYKDVSFNVVSTDFGGARIVKYVLKETGTEPKVPILMDKSAEIATKQYGISRFPFLIITANDGRVVWYTDGWEADTAQRIASEIEFRLKK